MQKLPTIDSHLWRKDEIPELNHPNSREHLKSESGRGKRLPISMILQTEDISRNLTIQRKREVLQKYH